MESGCRGEGYEDLLDIESAAIDCVHEGCGGDGGFEVEEAGDGQDACKYIAQYLLLRSN